MPVLRIDNYLDGYRLRAQLEDVHEMAARPGKKPLTEFVNRQIVDAIQPGPDDFLVDIGCGDATLLRMVSIRTANCVGIVGTVEEQRRLASTFPGLNFRASNAQALSPRSASSSAYLCSNVGPSSNGSATKTPSPPS